ncbi:cyclic nucleotide-binding domain protein [Jonquetella sp. BV3C21]|uniref:cAMP-binding protein n=2 Tax=Jonquetella TaxID=428711 RepID=H0ULS8_9BACT|nr:Crp/Fnr family transcriptional regulator [Jonquetella anthropi]EHM13569.1 cAMP-binding protein [Jonquetella anthropi DSM 22815]ERL24432.1 cyclic nucleotide-binding domain protein [Jonquetella sp. BV3C21]
MREGGKAMGQTLRQIWDETACRLLAERTPLFAGFDPHDLPLALACLGASQKEYAKGQTIINLGEPLRLAGVALSGTLHLETCSPDGERQIIIPLEPGDLYGGTEACAGQTCAPFRVVSLQPSRVLHIDLSSVVHPTVPVCPYRAKVMENLLRLLAGQNLQLQQKLEMLSAKSLRDRLLEYLKRQSQKAGSPSFLIPFSRAELADYLGADRSALSRELGRMKSDGLIDFCRSRFCLKM